MEKIFESNLINLIILDVGLFYLVGNALSDNLADRQGKILESIKESEKRLEEAITRLNENETQLSQTEVVIESIGKDAQNIAKQVSSTILTEGKLEVERLASSTKSQIDTIKERVRKEISDHISSLALQRITTQLENNLTVKLQKQIIDRNIAKLAK